MARFQDFNFKLIVIEQLMYVDKRITPAFDIFEVMREQGITDLHRHLVDNDLKDTILPQAREFFDRLELDDELLASVTTVTNDGGNQIYHQCSPWWDGEDELFDVASVADLDLLPNLRRIDGAFEAILGDAPDLERELEARGIEAA